MSYTLKILKQPKKYIAHLPKQERDELDEDIRGFESDPYPAGCKPLQGEFKGYWRVDFHHKIRVIYWVDERGLVVVVSTVGPRGDVYK